MAPIEIPRTSGIGTKLEGTHNYPSWFQQLKAELCATDPLYWPIIMGVNESPAEPKRIASVYVPNQQVERLLEETIEQNKLLSHKHDAEPEEWEQLNYRLRLKFCSTLDKVPASHIEQVFDARSAFLVIKSLYDGLNMQPVSLELQNWTSIRYKKDVQMETFLACFKQALEEYRKTGLVVDACTEQFQFIHAIKDYPNAMFFIQTLNLSPNNANEMEAIYDIFLLFA